MGYRRRILFEKLAIQIGAGVCLIGVFFLLAPRCVGSDPLAGMIFTLDGNWMGALLAVASLWILSALAGGGLAFVRPQGALMVPIVAMMGLCLYSESVRPWLWEYDQRLSSLYVWMIVELVIGAGVLFVAGLILDGTRRWATREGRVRLWAEPMRNADGSVEPVNVSHVEPDHRFLGLLSGIRHVATGLTKNADRQKARNARQTLLGFGLNVVVALILVVVLLKSFKHGQAIFAVGVGFFLATLIVQYICPIRALAGFLLAPVFGGVIFYVLAAMSLGGQTGPEAWMGVKLYAQPLPIDWLLAGTAGTMLGAWLSHRMIETGYMEKNDPQEETKESINE
jgi:hypothetical protein